MCLTIKNGMKDCIKDSQIPKEDQNEMLIGWIKENENKLRLVTHKDYELKVEWPEVYLVKKSLEYPKSYEEACYIMDWDFMDNDVLGYKDEALFKLQGMLLCKEAYWKVEGKEEKNGTHYIIEDLPLKLRYLFPMPSTRAGEEFYNNFKDTLQKINSL